MENENKNDLLTILRNLLEAYYNYFTGVVRLAKLETKLAIHSAILIALLFFVGIGLVVTSWISLLVVAFFILVSLHLSNLAAAAIVFASNIFLILLTLFTMHRLKKNFYFTATRKQILAPLHNEEKIDEPIEITNQAN